MYINIFLLIFFLKNFLEKYIKIEIYLEFYTFLSLKTCQPIYFESIQDEKNLT
jgi:hypothetical protein